MSYGSETPCNLIAFNVDGQADAIPYYTIHGNRQVLDREIKLTYNTLVWDDSTHWQEKEVVETFAALDQAVEILPPLCNTAFMLTGDRFLEEWGIGQGIEGEYFYTQAVGCGTTAEQEDRGNNNEKGLESGLGGSAPVHIIFTGYPTDAVVYRVWEMAKDQDFENVILQYNQDEVDYTFNEAGTYYMRYMVANADGSCESYGDVYTITVSESELVCPNIFSPGSKGFASGIHTTDTSVSRVNESSDLFRPSMMPLISVSAAWALTVFESYPATFPSKNTLE